MIPYVRRGGNSAVASPEECNPVPREIIKLDTPARAVVNDKVVELPWYVASLRKGRSRFGLLTLAVATILSERMRWLLRAADVVRRTPA